VVIDVRKNSLQLSCQAGYAMLDLLFNLTLALSLKRRGDLPSFLRRGLRGGSLSERL